MARSRRRCGIGGGFIALAIVILLVHRLTAGLRVRRAADRRKADLTAVGVAAALAVLPSLLRSRAGFGVLLAPAIALAAYAIYRENSRPKPGRNSPPTIGRPHLLGCGFTREPASGHALTRLKLCRGQRKIDGGKNPNKQSASGQTGIPDTSDACSGLALTGAVWVGLEFYGEAIDSGSAVSPARSPNPANWVAPSPTRRLGRRPGIRCAESQRRPVARIPSTPCNDACLETIWLLRPKNLESGTISARQRPVFGTESPKRRCTV